MDTLFSNQGSAAIESRLTELRAQLAASKALVKEKESALEQAIAAGTNSDRVLDELGKARSRVAALGSVIQKAAPELQAAQAREAAAARAKELRAFVTAAEKSYQLAKQRVGKLAEKLLAAIDDAAALDRDFTALAPEAPEGVIVFNVGRPLGGSAASLLRTLDRAGQAYFELKADLAGEKESSLRSLLNRHRALEATREKIGELEAEATVPSTANEKEARDA